MEEFLSNLVSGGKTASYYFDSKDISKLKQYKSQIKEFNKLLGINKEEFDVILRDILRKNFNIVHFIPLLVSCRETELDLLLECSYDEEWNIKTYSFDSKIICGKKITGIIEFFERIGLKDFFINSEIDDVYSYILGSHLGVRTGARKNKSGSFMESYVEGYLKEMCERHNLEYISQADAEKIFEHFNIDIKNISKTRRFDFVIINIGKLILIEVNFYNTPGSKMKSTANEYIKLYGELEECEYIQDFVWITDGPAWIKEKRPLKNALDNIDNMINLHQMHSKYLQSLIIQNTIQ